MTEATLCNVDGCFNPGVRTEGGSRFWLCEDHFNEVMEYLDARRELPPPPVEPPV